jgi:hypothetical protein
MGGSKFVFLKGSSLAAPVEDEKVEWALFNIAVLSCHLG